MFHVLWLQRLVADKECKRPDLGMTEGDGYLLDLRVKLPHLLNSTAVIVRSPERVNTIPKVSSNSKAGASCMTTNNC